MSSTSTAAAKLSVVLLAALASMILHGCGGGSGGDSTTTTTTPHSPVGGPCPAKFPLNYANIIIGQSNASEIKAIGQSNGWGSGASVYWAITEQKFDRSDVVEAAVSSNAKYMQLSIAIGGYHDPVGTYKLLQAINGGTYDSNIDWIRENVFEKYKDLTWLVRIGYEVCLHYWANPDGGPVKADAYYIQHVPTYQAAFKRVADKLHASSNVKTIFHPYRLDGGDDPVNNMKMYPGDDSVDYIGISLFNNDVCQPYFGQGPPSAQYPYCDPAKYTYDNNMKRMLTYAKTNYKKPLMIPESTTQPPSLGKNTSQWIDALNRSAQVVIDFDMKFWTYIATDWWANGFPVPVWGDTRFQTNPDVLKWWNACILKSGHALPERTAAVV